MRGFRDLSDAWSARLREAIPQAYDRVIDAAIANEVDFVVLAGDAFDTSQPSYGDYIHFFEGLHRLDEEGIPLYLVPGNHDPFSVWQNDIERLPPSAHMMGADAPEFTLFERDGEPLCLIGARGYRSQAWPIDEPISQGISRRAAIQALGGAFSGLEDVPFCLGIIHTGLDLDQAKAFSNPHDLLAADVDYWACGHLHEALALPSENDPRVVFPGCIQGRDLKESDDRGCFLVTLEKDDEGGCARASLERINTASVIFQTVTVDISASRTLADVAHYVRAQLFHENARVSSDEMVVRIVLVGATQLHEFLAQPAVLSDLRKRINNAYPSFYCDALIDNTRLPRDRPTTLHQGLFEAHVIRVADEQRSLPEEMVNFVQAEFVKRGIDVPSSLTRKMADFNDAAETLVLDLLEEEAE